MKTCSSSKKLGAANAGVAGRSRASARKRVIIEKSEEFYRLYHPTPPLALLFPKRCYARQALLLRDVDGSFIAYSFCTQFHSQCPDARLQFEPKGRRARDSDALPIHKPF